MLVAVSLLHHEESTSLDDKIDSELFSTFIISHLILVGDVDQLPSVGAGNVLKDILQSETVPTTYLTKNKYLEYIKNSENSII